MEFGFEEIETNFPPYPAPIRRDNDVLVCDLMRYDPPTDFPSNVLSENNLKELKLFVDNLKSIPDDIGHLRNLEKLVLAHFESHSHGHRTKLPQTLKNLRQLRSIDLQNNPLSRFPTQLLSLEKLKELFINNCELSALPEQLAQLQSLEVLDLSNNSLKTIPVCVTKLVNLRKLYMSGVKLETVPPCIHELSNLERLQLRNNQITSVPDELFLLVNLEKLSLNNNQITSIGDTVNKLVKLKHLCLNQNKLKRLPDTIGDMEELRYLNLYDNMLTCLPESIKNLVNIKTLLVDSNPLQIPPVNVCNQGIDSITNYFTAKRNTGGIHSKRLKVVLLGESMAGKTSLVNALVNGEACHINSDDRTFGVAFYHWKPEPHVDDLELLVIDCAGQQKYQMTHRLFLSEGALFLLVVSLKLYKFDNPDYLHECIGQWVDLLAARICKAKILIVPTHVDCCSSQEEIDLKCENIVNYVIEEQAEMKERIDKKVNLLLKTEGRRIPEVDRVKLVAEQEERKNDLPVISIQYKKVGKEVQQSSMSVLPVSNVGHLQGMIELRRELVRIARNKNLVPTIDIELPESWVRLETTVKDLQKGKQIPCVSVDELQELLRGRDVVLSEPELYSCLSYLCAIGELLYFKDISSLSKKVVLNPCWFAAILKLVFRHDLKEQLNYNDNCRKLGVHLHEFNQDKQELFTNGVMSVKLLRCIWCEQIKETDDIFYELLVIFTHFGLACEMQATTSNLDESECPSPCYLMPWFLSNKRPSLEEKCASAVAANQVEVTVGYSLLQYVPVGVFERFSVLCHSHKPEEFEHWQNGLCMMFGNVHVLGVVLSKQKCSTITLTAEASRRELFNLWRTLLVLLKEVQKLLDEWPGMNYVKFTVCPECVKLSVAEPFKFTINWFKPLRCVNPEAVCKNKTLGKTHRVKVEYLFPTTDHSSVSPPVQDCVLPEDFDHIAESLGPQWPVLARRLGMSRKVDSIKDDNRCNVHEQAVEMLKLWKQNNGNDAKVGVLVTKLNEMEFKELAEWLEQKYF